MHRSHRRTGLFVPASSIPRLEEAYAQPLYIARSLLLCAVWRISSDRGASKAALAGPANPTSLAQLSASLQDIAWKVEPSVVQVVNSSYTIERGGEAVVLPQRNSGLGILNTSDDYIVTNAHVVEGSRQPQVRLNAAASNVGSRVLNAKLIGANGSRRHQDRSGRTSLPHLRRFPHYEPGDKSCSRSEVFSGWTIP